MQKRWLLFSQIEDLTPSQWEEGKFDESQSIDPKLQNLVQNRWIDFWDKSTLPQAFERVKPKPKILYWMGNKDLLSRYIFWIVGPRKPTSRGKTWVSKLFEELQAYPQEAIATISGLANGIDLLAHQLSIQHKIPTIAVLGGWIGFYLQKWARTIIEQILDWGGLILSEFKLFAAPAKYTFPQRNRIIAWLSNLLFVPQASKGSGSLITVDFANKFWTPVVAPFGDALDPFFEWVNCYIREGKINPLCQISQIEEFISLPKLKSLQKSAIDLSALDGLEKQIVELLQVSPLDSSQIAAKLGMPLPQVLVTLTNLEIKKIITFDQGSWRLAR